MPRSLVTRRLFSETAASAYIAVVSDKVELRKDSAKREFQISLSLLVGGAVGWCNSYRLADWYCPFRCGDGWE